MNPSLNAAIAACLLFSACSPGRGTIGAVLAKSADGQVYVRDTPVGLAANKAGLLPGDEILLIDGLTARDLSPAELHARLSGEVGEFVKLTLVRNTQIIRVTLSRTPTQRLARPHRPEPAGEPAPAP